MDTILQCYGTTLCHSFNVYQESPAVTVVPSPFFFCCSQDAQFMVDSLKSPYRPSSCTEDLFVPHVTQGAMCRRGVLSTGLYMCTFQLALMLTDSPGARLLPLLISVCVMCPVWSSSGLCVESRWLCNVVSSFEEVLACTAVLSPRPDLQLPHFQAIG